MKKEEEIRTLLRKFILNKCNREETEKVITFFQKKRSSDDIPGVEEVIQLLDELPVMNEETKENVFQNIIEIKKQQRKQSSRRSFNLWKYAVAAVLVGGILTTFFSSHFTSYNIEKPIEESITIELENGELRVIEQHDSIILKNNRGGILGRLEEDKLVYNPNQKVDSLKYNTITIPYGKKFSLQLSDGTIVHLNAGTSLRYPIQFMEGHNRQVFLKGEAYFDVTRNDEQPFIVRANDLDVRVLGTSFNVNSYPESDAIEVVLVEGSVAMQSGSSHSEDEATILKPGFMGSFNINNHFILTHEVSTRAYTSWISGELVFRDKPFQDILMTLERHYNVEVVNTNTRQIEETFNASFINEPLDKVLQYLQRIYNIDYSYKEGKVIIK